jgi:arginine:pyruvate transaminase
MRASRRVSGIVEGGSDGWEVYYRARALRAEGRPAINLTVGDHDIKTAPDVIDAMMTSARAGNLGYSPVMGAGKLRDAVAARVAARTGVPTARENVIIVPGGQAGLFAAMQTAFDVGEACILIDPWYANFPLTVRAASGVIVRAPALAENRFAPDPAAIDAAAAESGARAILVNTPNNPTGAVYSRAALEGIAEICRRRDMWLISDELYDSQVYDGEHVSPRALPGMAERTLTVGSLSKSHAMTGWRCGWVVGPAEAIALMGDLANATTYGIPGFVMDAAHYALTHGADGEAEVAARYRRRRDSALAALAGANRVRAAAPAGGMYLMVDIRETGMSGSAFAAALLEAEGVAVMPGESFGAAAAGHLRVALTAPEDALSAAMGKLAGFAAAQAG